MGNQIPKRSEIDEKYKWRLEDIYESNEAWEKDFVRVQQMADALAACQGQITASAEALQRALDLEMELSKVFENVYVYAQMRSHEDSALALYQELAGRADSLSVEVSGKTAFVVPEILSVDAKRILEYIEERDGLKIYSRLLNEILRQKPHVLSAQEEVLLAKAGELAQAPETIFAMINDADIKFPYVKNDRGEEVELTKGRYAQLMDSQNREVRKGAYEALYQTYQKQRNTLAATLAANVKANLFSADVRHFDGAMEAALFGDNVSAELYNHLLEAIHHRMDLMYRYVALRKKALGLDELHMYDMYVPMVKDVDFDITYEQAVQLTLDGLQVLGSEYISNLKKGFEHKWIDIYENEGKRSGAYSWGSYQSHPYVLLNHNNDLTSAFTIAHEMGHAMHSYYSNHTQHYVDAQYSIFVAEVASTLNESLLIRHMIEHTEDRSKKLYLINHYLEQFRTTVYRQVMFAEFEKCIHEKAQRGETLTADSLCEIYGGLNRLYYGDEVVTDGNISLEWARVPHFYNSFYVYKYATGFAAATALAQNILNGGQAALDKYITFISSGGNDYPVEQLKKAGVDMNDPRTVENALDVFEDLLKQMEALL